jgi:hypothetical protein
MINSICTLFRVVTYVPFLPKRGSWFMDHKTNCTSIAHIHESIRSYFTSKKNPFILIRPIKIGQVHRRVM